MVIFEGRILQCSQGHAVCEKCQLQLTECPHCRGVYVGTRNYVLEEVIAKLKRLNSTTCIGLGDEDVGSKSDLLSTETKSTNEAPSDAATTASVTSESMLVPSGKRTIYSFVIKFMYKKRNN